MNRKRPPRHGRFTAGTRALAVLGLFLSVVVVRPVRASEDLAATAAKVERKDAELPDAELERLLGDLLADSATSRISAARAVESLGPDAVPALAKKLAELRGPRAPSSASTTAAIKQAREAAGKDADLGDALVKNKGDGPGYRTAVTTVVIGRALSRIGTTPAVRALVKVAVDHGGVLKAEIAQQVKTLGDKAVPALIETRKEPSSELRHWAFSQLEGLGKRVPGDAVQTKDNQVLTDVLRAFAAVHDLDALPVLLSFVNSDRIQIRGAAREALGQFGQDAVWKLREAYANVVGKAAPETWPAAQIAKELFAAYDRLRLQEVYGLLDEGLAKEKDGKLEEATAAFDKVLARQPMLDRRAEMVGAYAQFAASLEESDPPRSLSLFRKALRLWPESPRGPHIEAEIAYLEGKELLGRGIADVDPFKRALTLDPGHDRARAELSRLENNIEERQDRLRAIAAAGAVILVALVGILLFGGRRRSLVKSAV